MVIAPNEDFVPTRAGISPIGTASANSGSTAATNSTYAPGAYTSGIASNAGTTYTLNDTDYQGIIIFNTPSAVTVTLNGAVKTNFQCSILNLGSGQITLTPDSVTGYLVNGLNSLTMASSQGCQVFFANRSWVAFIGSTVIPAVPSASTTIPTTDGGSGAVGTSTNYARADHQHPGTTIGSFAYAAKTATYTITVNDYQIECTANSFTVTLPTASGISGQVFSIKNSGTGTITVATTSSQTIDGSLTQTLAQRDNIVVMSNGTGWIIL